MKVKFTVPIEPQSKLRHRTTKRGHAYTPQKTVDYENLVKQYYWIANKNKMLQGQIRATIRTYFKIPKSTSKKRKELMLTDRIRPTKKPDTDNLAKAILDALNDLAYKDDKQVVELVVKKYYSEEPRVEVELEQIGIEV